MKDFKWKDEQMDKEIKDNAINTLKFNTLWANVDTVPQTPF